MKLQGKSLHDWMEKAIVGAYVTMNEYVVIECKYEKGEDSYWYEIGIDNKRTGFRAMPYQFSSRWECHLKYEFAEELD